MAYRSFIRVGSELPGYAIECEGCRVIWAGPDRAGVLARAEAQDKCEELPPTVAADVPAGAIGSQVGMQLATAIGDAFIAGAAALAAKDPKAADKPAIGATFMLGLVFKALGKSTDPNFRPDLEKDRISTALREVMDDADAPKVKKV